jgi:hypothetical protein
MDCREHLYKHHRIFPCQRCKVLFQNQQEVNQHLKEPKACELVKIDQADGVTSEMVERLRCKKKTHKGQTEEERWEEIYNLLFADEIAPSPCRSPLSHPSRSNFHHQIIRNMSISQASETTNMATDYEPIQEDIQSPDSRVLAEYEEYCRQELPRYFRASLEEMVYNEGEPFENIRSQLMNMIRDCQDRVFSKYRATATPALQSSMINNRHSPQPSQSHPASEELFTHGLSSQDSSNFETTVPGTQRSYNWFDNNGEVRNTLENSWMGDVDPPIMFDGVDWSRFTGTDSALDPSV